MKVIRYLDSDSESDAHGCALGAKDYLFLYMADEGILSDGEYRLLSNGPEGDTIFDRLVYMVRGRSPSVLDYPGACVDLGIPLPWRLPVTRGAEAADRWIRAVLIAQSK